MFRTHFVEMLEQHLCPHKNAYREKTRMMKPTVVSFYGLSAYISFRIDWFDFLAVQGSLKRLLQHHNLKASVLRHSAFFMVQLSYPYMTTIKPKL